MRNAPSPRAGQAAVWSGEEMIVWGGWADPSPLELGTGGRYNPVSRTWSPTTLENAPQARFFNAPHPAVWTGQAMFIYGGYDYPVSLNSGALYYPESLASTVEELLRLLDSPNLPRKGERPLEAALEAALDSLQRGNNKAAGNQLEAFRQKVRAQLGSDSPVAQRLIDAAQAIIDRL